MKKKLILFVAFIILCVAIISMLCSGIFDRDINMQSAEIRLGYSRYTVTSDGMLCYENDDIERSKKLTPRQCEEIDSLITKVKADPYHFSMGDYVAISAIEFIYATIDGVEYGALEMPWMNSYNKPDALQELAYKLIDISPVNKDHGEIRLRILGDLWHWSEAGLAVRFGNRIFGIYYWDMPLMILCTVPLGVLLGILFGLLAMRFQKKWLHFVPYIICLVGMAISLVLMFAIHSKYFVAYMYSVSTGVFALVAQVITILSVKHIQKKKIVQKGVENE